MIIVVDDDMDSLFLMERALKALMLPYAPFLDPEDALLTFNRAPSLYTGAILDVHMLKISGEVLADEFRAKIPGLPVLFVTGLTDEYNVKRLKEKGLYLKKDFNQRQLAESINRLMGLVNRGDI